MQAACPGSGTRSAGHLFALQPESRWGLTCPAWNITFAHSSPTHTPFAICCNHAAAADASSGMRQPLKDSLSFLFVPGRL